MNREALIEKILAKDKEAMEFIVGIFHEKTGKVFHASLLKKSRIWEPKDLFQISFEQFWKELTCNPEKEIENLEGYIYGLVKNQSFKILQKERSGAFSVVEKIAGDQILRDYSPEEQFLKKEHLRGRQKIFQAALKTMVEKGKAFCVKILTMNFDRKISDEEAGKKLNIDKDKLRFRRRDCKNMLKRLMGNDPDFKTFS
ncbi:MAG: sigma-70 family RNA polymerase sigma factor [Bacteroidetes bacterium]|nr:sigma-70 family RNA polymerase sigma factor [Bacteroidota bacterium]